MKRVLGWPGLRYSEAPGRSPGLRSTSAPATLMIAHLFRRVPLQKDIANRRPFTQRLRPPQTVVNGHVRIDAQTVIDGRRQVGGRRRLSGGIGGEAVARTVYHAPLDAA